MKEKSSIDEPKLELPVKFRVNQFIRWITLLFGLFVLGYAIYFIFFELTAEMPKIKKFLPFIMFFLGLNSVSKNLFTVNSISMNKEGITFGYLLKKSDFIEWNSIFMFKFKMKKGKAIIIHYTDSDNKEKTYALLLSFNNMLEIMNYFSKYAVNATYDEMLKPIILNNKGIKKEKK